MRIITWNCRRANAKSKLWDHFVKLNPDIALLQEVSGIPLEVLNLWQAKLSNPISKSGNLQKFATATLVRGEFVEPFPLCAPEAWVTEELKRFSGNLPAWHIRTSGSEPVCAINVYSPAWPLDPSRLTDVITKGIQLELNKKVWVADLLWGMLRNECSKNEDCSLIAGGDFNLSETFDSWRGGPRGNREFLDRMQSIGLVECLRIWNSALTPTFRTPKGKVIHQIDHLFVTQDYARKLKN